MSFDMANLGPKTTGIGAVIHVYQDLDRRSRHGPRIKVFPGRPSEGNATTITVPTHPTEEPSVIGKSTVSAKVLKLATKFVELNWRALALYWSYEDYNTDELLEDLKVVK